MTRNTGEGATSELTELRNLILETQTATQSSIQQLGEAVGAVKPVPAVTEFVAKLQFLELPDYAIVTAGHKAILHIHEVVEECEIIELISQIDMKTRKPMKKKILFVKNGAAVVCRIQVANPICIEKISDFPQLGRFTLRSEGKTIAVGKVTALSGASSSA